MRKPRIIPAHEEKITLTEVLEIPSHTQRGSESAEFIRNVKRIKADGHGSCFICGATENLQAHHIAERSEWPNVDPVKLKAFLLIFDAYDYSKALANEPIDSPDDIRNLLILRREVSHREVYRNPPHAFSFVGYAVIRKERRRGYPRGKAMTPLRQSSP